MDKRDSIMIVAALLLVGYTGSVAQYVGVPVPGLVVNVVLGIGRVWAIVLLVQEGSLFNRSPYFELIAGALGLAGLGVLFKIMHWSAAHIMMLVGFAAMGIIYTVTFFQKPVKRLLDVLKLLWVWVLVPAVITMSTHMLPIPISIAYYLLATANALFFTTYLVFAWQTLKQDNTTST